MTFWAYFWTSFLVFGFVAFLGLAVVVSIGGLFDIHALFTSLRSQHDREPR